MKFKEGYNIKLNLFKKSFNMKKMYVQNPLLNVK